MKTQALAVLTLLAGVGGVSVAAQASNSCSAPISAFARSSNVDGSADFVTYHGHVPPTLAKTRAIAHWRTKVSAHCPDSSTYWWRAAGKHVDCEGSAGHMNCTATATPARKLLSVLKH